jgi:hypothetical protein
MMETSCRKRKQPSSPTPETGVAEYVMNLDELGTALHELKSDSGVKTRTQKSVLEGQRLLLESSIERLMKERADNERISEETLRKRQEENMWCRKIIGGDYRNVDAAKALNENEMYVSRMVKRYKTTGTVFKHRGRLGFLDKNSSKLLEIECKKRSLEGLGFTR